LYEVTRLESFLQADISKLDCVFNPRSVAFVGATEAKVKWGFIIFNNLVIGGYEGELYPVNPGHEEIMGMKCYARVSDIPGDVDLAVFTVPAKQVLASLDDCATKGVSAALVITAGFSEVGEEGAELEAEMVRKADEAGIVLVGPNGQGVCSPGASLYTWMPIFFPTPGEMSFVSQSGNILNMLIDHALDAGFGVSKAVSSGNEAMLRSQDYFSYLSKDPGTQVIVSYIEGMKDGRDFFTKASDATRRKPVIVLKGGRSSSGMKAASSHTGALAVSSNVFSSAARQAGVIEARSIEEAGTIASAFMNRPLPEGKRVGIVTGGGGLGVIAADACADEGLEVVKLSDETLASIGQYMPDYWVPGNPVDLVAGLDLRIIKPILEVMLHSGEIDALLFIFVEAQQSKGKDVRTEGAGRGYELGELWSKMAQQLGVSLQELYGVMREAGVPIYAVLNYSRIKRIKADPEPGGKYVMIFDEVEFACAAMSAMYRYHEYLQRTD